MSKVINTRIPLIVVAGVLALAPMIAAGNSVQSDAVSISGRVSCSRFGLGPVTARKGMSAAQTIQYCASFQAGDYTLVSGNLIYRLVRDTKGLAKMSGRKVSIAGRMVSESPDDAAYASMGTVEVNEVVPNKE